MPNEKIEEDGKEHDGFAYHASLILTTPAALILAFDACPSTVHPPLTPHAHPCVPLRPAPARVTVSHCVVHRQAQLPAARTGESVEQFLSLDDGLEENMAATNLVSTASKVDNTIGPLNVISSKHDGSGCTAWITACLFIIGHALRPSQMKIFY